MVNILQYTDINSIVNSMSTTYKKERGNYLFVCPYHNDHNPSLSLRPNGFFKCFACGEKGFVTKLYKTITGRSLYRDQGIVTNYLENSYKEPKYLLHENKDSYESSIQKKIDKEIIIKGNLLDVYENPNKRINKYLNTRSISKEFIDYFNIKYCNFCRINGTKYYDRLIIPIVEQGKIICYEGRDFTEKQKTKVVYNKDSVVSTLFNYDNLDKEKELIVVEGITDLVKLWQAGYKNITCTFGSQLAVRQFKLLKEFKNITLFVDNDEAGFKMVVDLSENYEYEFYLTFPEKEGFDPGNLDIKESIDCLKRKKSFTEFMIENMYFEGKEKNYEWE